MVRKQNTEGSAKHMEGNKGVRWMLFTKIRKGKIMCNLTGHSQSLDTCTIFFYFNKTQM